MRTKVLAVLAGLAAVCGGVTSTASPAAAADGPGVGTPYVVSVGDSFISGEAGRWAGNTDANDTGRIDAGTTSYFDNAANTAETMPLCHRSKAAEIHIGGGVLSKNFACSGALTWTVGSCQSATFKPGVDFFNDPACPSRKGQAQMLEEWARTHNVKAVNLSIGGNNFKFADIVSACVRDFMASSVANKDFCRDDAAVTANFTAANVTTQTTKIKYAIQNVRTAMAHAGYAANQYTVVVQNYPNILATGPEMRRAENLGGFTRQTKYGCGFWDADANWAAATAVPTINNAVRTAAASAVAAGPLNNVKFLDIQNAFAGRKLCQSTVNLIEEAPGLIVGGVNVRGTDARAVDKLEWVDMVRASADLNPFSPFMLQESIHPNYWGQKALRNCVRQAYNAGAPRGGTCGRGANTGVNAKGEPNMTFTPA